MIKLEKEICPKCNQEYSEIPSLSRMDNKTHICPDCGTRESLELIGINKYEQEETIKRIDEVKRGL